MENTSSKNLIYWVVGIIVIIVIIILVVSSGSDTVEQNNNNNAVPGTNTAQKATTSTPTKTPPPPPPSKTPALVPIKPPNALNNTPTPPVPAGNPIIHFTSSGFSPTAITIKAGTPVTFVNDSTAGMWIASNPHPTHGDYSDLDEGRTVGKNGTYTFAFLKVGTWGFHNHLNPSKGGTITVVKQ